MTINWKAVWTKIVNWFIRYGKYVIGILAVVIIGIITVATLNKFGSIKLFTTIKEWAFLKDRGYKKKGDAIVDKETGTVIDIPEPYQDETVTGIGHTEEVTIGDVATHEEAVDESENEKTCPSTTLGDKDATRAVQPSLNDSVSTSDTVDNPPVEIQHKVVDRKNVEPIENSAKDVLTNKRK